MQRQQPQQQQQQPLRKPQPERAPRNAWKRSARCAPRMPSRAVSRVDGCAGDRRALDKLVVLCDAEPRDAAEFEAHVRARLLIMLRTHRRSILLTKTCAVRI